VSSIRALVPSGAKLRYHALLRASSSVVDRSLGIETAVKVNLADLGLAHPERVGYEAGIWLDLPRVLHRGEVGRDDVFLDLGCGKGRAVLTASLLPFGRITGVELSPHLANIARRNVATFRLPKRCANRDHGRRRSSVHGPRRRHRCVPVQPIPWPDLRGGDPQPFRLDRSAPTRRAPRLPQRDV
jgi:SAM-dependent methyltransferase